MASTEEGEWENTQQPYVFWNKNSALGKTTLNLLCICVNKQQNSVPLGLAPIQGLACTARGSRWCLCTISDFRLQVNLGAALASSQCSVGASWHTQPGRNTESAWLGPVLWLRCWWWKCCTILFSAAVPLQMAFWLRALRDLPIAVWI